MLHGGLIRVFISQPMNGLSEKEIMVERKKAIKDIAIYLNSLGYYNIEILNTYFDLDENSKPLHYLAKSIEILADADIVYFVEGWESARGCKIEETCAREYGIECIY